VARGAQSLTVRAAAVPALPADPALGPIAFALDGDAVTTALAPHLPGLDRCRARYVRYKPGRQLLVLYDLERDGRTTLGHLTALLPRRAERLWARVAGSGLLKPGSACHVPELAAVMQLFPVDVKLPGLVEASSTRAMAAALGADDCSLDLVRYKPGRRAVLRYRLGRRVVYGKLRGDGAGAAHVALGRALIDRGIPTPAPQAYLPDLGMTIHGELRGTRLAELRNGALEAWMEPVAEVLVRLHVTRIAGLPAHSMEAEAADLRAAAETAAALLPARRADVEALTERLTAELAAVAPAECTIHGSFHDDQVLVGDHGVALLDLDSAARGHPLLDVGHFASYLAAAGQDAARARFLAAYARLRPTGPAALLFESAALLRWSSLPFRDLDPGWPAAVERRLDLARARLSEYDR
jgi:phosphotransferase family enzyme